jgi:hypothetical protein
MRPLSHVVLLAVAVPALVTLPVVQPAVAKPRPVAASVVSVPIAGVDRAAEAQVGRSSATVSARTRAALPAAERGAAPSERPSVLTREIATEDFESLGVTWRAGTGGDVTVLVRTRGDDGWSDWTGLEKGEDVDPAAPAAVRDGTEPYYAGESDAVQVRVDVRSGAVPADLKVELIDPGDSPADASIGATPASTAAAAAVQPKIYSRKDWGANEAQRSGSPTYMPTIKAAVVHHTAGVNGYSSEQVPAIIRSDYAYHTKSRGWSDLGYNFVVDRFGRLWEGRAGGINRAVQGAHAGGFNYETFGVSAIGNYETASAPTAMQTAIAKLIAWKFSLHGVNPTAKVTLTSAGGGTARYARGKKVSLPTIMGHRDVGYTACPGANLYPKLASIRSKAQSYLKAAPSDASVPERQDTVGATAADSGADLLVRNSAGNLAHQPWSVTAGLGTPTSLGGVTKEPPAVVGSDPSQLDAFVVGTDDAIYTSSRPGPSAAWTRWSSLGGRVSGRPAAVRTDSGGLVVYARGTDGAIYARSRAAASSSWDGWARLGDVDAVPSGAGLAATAPGDGTERVVYRGTDGGAWTLTRTSATGAVQVTSLGGRVLGDPAIAASSGGLVALVRGTDSALYSMDLPDGTPTRWIGRGGHIITSPAAAGSAGAAALTAFADGGNELLYRITRIGSTWSGWSRA